MIEAYRKVFNLFFPYQISIAQKCTGGGFFTSWEVLFPQDGKTQLGSILSCSNNLVWMQIQVWETVFPPPPPPQGMCWPFIYSLLASCYKPFPFSEAWASLIMATGV